MKTLNVVLKDHRYPIVVGKGLLASAGKYLWKQGFRTNPIVISNSTVMRLHGAKLLASLHDVYEAVPVIKIGDGERFKNHDTLMKIYDGMFRVQANRRSWIIAFGGGVVGDIAGFAAATFMRGIPYVMIPTTLLSQVDSSIGGKVAVNAKQGKNLIGAFYQPSVVLSDSETLGTLPKRELVSGLHEVIKYAAICSNPLLCYLEQKLPEILNCRTEALEHIVLASARIKADVVAVDEKETGLRMILNFGHTIGHAFEAATDFRKFKHGEAVAWGMIAVLDYCREVKLLNSADSSRLIQLIHRAGKLPSISGIQFASLWKALMHDKKFRKGDIRMVLLQSLGKAAVYNGIEKPSLQNFLQRFLAGSKAFA